MRGSPERLGHVELRNIGSETVRSWFASLPDTPRRNSHAYGLLYAILATAVTDDLLAANPCTVKHAGNAR